MIEWIGNLKDDCKADWNGFHLHAEEMDRNYWWWAISDENSEILASSDDYHYQFTSGKKARAEAEKVAKKLSGNS